MKETRARLHYIPELDGIRGIAVLAVVMLHFHSPFASWAPFGPVSWLIGGGWAGVDIFFVLSGYLITSILLATREAENYFSAFYARRALRIAPLYLLALAAYFWILLPMAHRHGLVMGFHTSEQIWYWTFLGNIRQGLGYNDGAGVAHFWSLAIEEQFYVFFSLMAMLLSRRALMRLCVGMIGLSIALRAGFFVTGHFYALLPRLTLLHLDPIAMGALLACSQRFREVCARWAVVLIAVGLVGIYAPLPAAMGITAAGLAATGAIALGCSSGVPMLRGALLRSLGKYSYAMYVLHDFLAGGVANLAKRHHSLGFALASVVGGTAASYGLAWVSWQVLEERFQRLKHRFPYRVRGPETAEVDRHLITAGSSDGVR